MTQAQPPERLAEYLRAKIAEAQAAYDKAMDDSMDANVRLLQHTRDLKTYKDMLGILEREAAAPTERREG